MKLFADNFVSTKGNEKDAGKLAFFTWFSGIDQQWCQHSVMCTE